MTKKAQIIAKLIEEKGYKKRAFAKMIGIPPTTLQSMLTRGIGKASVDNVVKVCRGLGISTEELERMANNTNADYFFGNTESKNTIIPEKESPVLDESITKMFNTLSDKDKKEALRYITFLKMTSETENEISSTFEQKQAGGKNL